MACRFRIKFQVYRDGSSPAAAAAAATSSVSINGGGGDKSTTTTTTTTTATSFTLFSSLPPELRLKIWDFAASVPRIVLASCITQGLDAEGFEGEGAGADPGRTTTEQQQLLELSSRRACRFVPALLHANHEARARALERHYSLTFSWKVPHVFASIEHYHHHNHNRPPYLSSSSSSAAAAAAAESSDSNNNNNNNSQSSSSPPPPGPPAWSQPRVYFNFARDALYLLGELEPYDSFGFNSPMTYFLRREDTARVRCVAVAFSALKYGETGSQQIFGSLFHIVDRFPLCSTATASSPPYSGTNGGGSSDSSGANGVGAGSLRGARKAEQQQQQQQPHVLVCVTPGDEWTHALLGGTEPLVKGHRGEWEHQRDFGHMPQSQRQQERQQRRQQQQQQNSGNHGGGGGGGAGQHPNNSNPEEQEQEQYDEMGGEPDEPEPENVVQKIWTDWYRGSIVKSRMADVRFKLITEDELESVVTGQPATARPPGHDSGGGSSRRDDYRELHDALGKYLHGAA